MSQDWPVVTSLSLSYQQEREENRRDNSWIRISGIGDCRRKMAYRTLWDQQGLSEPPIWTHALSIFDMGHKLHLGLQHRLSNAGPLKWVDADPIVEDGQFGYSGNFEVRLQNPQYRLRGTLDALTRPLLREERRAGDESYQVLRVAEPGETGAKRYLIDIKTITAREKVKVNWKGETVVYQSAFDKLTEAKSEHVSQASLYSWMTTQPEFQTEREAGPLPEMPEVMIIYLAKDLDPEYYSKYPEDYSQPKGLLNSPFKVFTVPASPLRIQALLNKTSEVWTHLDKGELPARDYHHTPSRPAWECVGCPFRATCWEHKGYFREDLDPQDRDSVIVRKEMQLVS